MATLRTLNETSRLLFISYSVVAISSKHCKDPLKIILFYTEMNKIFMWLYRFNCLLSQDLAIIIYVSLKKMKSDPSFQSTLTTAN